MGTAWLEGQPDLPPLLPGSLLLFLKGRLISDLKLFDGLPWNIQRGFHGILLFTMG